jgi:hypothetical protein
MTVQLIRGRVRAAVLILSGMAALAGCAAPATAAAAKPQAAALTADVAGKVAASLPVVVNCAAHAQTRPGQYILACGNGGAYLARLNWASWGPAAAFAEGISTINDCVPNCVAGHGHSFPVLVALWRAEPLPGHAGQRYFTQLTLIYTGSRSYHAGGKQYSLPATATYPLSASGGA